MENEENQSVSVTPSVMKVDGKARSRANLKPFKKGSDERRELARAAKRPTMKIGDALKKVLDRRVAKSWVKPLFKTVDWELMERLLSDKPRIGELLAVRMAVGAMSDSYLLDMVLNRTDGKVVQPVAGAFGAVIKVELPPEAQKGPVPEVLDCEYRPEEGKMDEHGEDTD